MFSARHKSSANVKTMCFLPWFLRVKHTGLFLYTRTRVGVIFILTLLSILLAPAALAESSTSANYQLDYARFTNDSDQKTSTSYQLTDSISDISVEGSSVSFKLRNVYSDLGVICGNGTIETSEQCEGMNFNGLTCSSYGFNSGSLQCANCQIITTGCFNTGGGGRGGGGGGFMCGNGVREAGEQCDDGNTQSGDGCSSGCRIEDFRCGNGIKEGSEQCDDGNVNTGDGCTPQCTLEGVVEPPIEPPVEPPVEPIESPVEPETPEEPTPIPEIAPGTPTPEELPDLISPTPSEPDLKPSAPDTDTDTIQVLSAYDYHYDSYQPGQIVTVLDETPFIVTQADSNAIYEIVIYDTAKHVITRQGAQATPNGVLMFEGIPFLNYTTYGVTVFDTNQELFKSWTINIEDRQYRLHDNLFANGELSREHICLGSFEELETLSGNGKPNTIYHAYLQKIEKQGDTVSEITHIETQADEFGNYELGIPQKLEDGSYLLNIVQVYEDGKVQRNKRYIFNIENKTRKINPWVLLSIFTILLIGFPLKKPEKGKKKVRSRLAMAIAVAMLIQQSAFAAVTTPAVFVYEGKLLDSSNNPITTAQTFRFSLWNSDDMVAGDVDGVGAINAAAPAYGGWTETHTLTPNADGTFFVELGSATPLPNMLLSTHTHLMVEIKASGAPDTSYELMDPTGDNGTDTDDRQTVGSVPYTNNADFIDNAEIGTSVGDIATLGVGGIFDTSLMPAGTDLDSWTIDVDNSVVAGTIDLIFGTALAEFLRFDIANDWFSFSNDVDFGQNEIKNVAIDNQAGAPAAPVTGQIYHNTTDGNTYVWNGTTWDDITAGATGVDDLDGVYGADADKKMAVNNASGLEFESSVAGNIVVDLQSTGDFVVQDAGTPFAIFTDGGYFGIGNTSPISVFHIDSNAANTAAIATFENTAGDIQFFRSDASPEGTITGSIGDMLIDGTNGNAYIKNTGTATNTGWLQIGGIEGKTAVFHAEYEDSAIQGDGTANKGLLSSYFADAGGTSKYNYYEWTTRQSNMQDVDIVISFRLPEDFQSFTATPLSVLYRTSDGVLTTNQIDIALYDTTGTAVTLTGAANLANAAWTTSSITFGGTPTFTAGDVVTLVIKPQTTNTGYARVSDVIFNYNST